jgi:hypothetical protein
VYLEFPVFSENIFKKSGPYGLFTLNTVGKPPFHIVCHAEMGTQTNLGDYPGRYIIPYPQSLVVFSFDVIGPV